MGLSSELVSQFLGITKKAPKTKKETTVFGTTVLYEDKMYVQLDGSELLTPLGENSTTTNMEPDQRVTVLIKNHTATITGNMSSPSATNNELKNVDDKLLNITANSVTTEQLNAEKARITQLEADKVTINTNLIAAFADIDRLKVNKLDATYTNIIEANVEDLKAAKGDIDDLKANKLDANVARITYATIDSLDATNARINNLGATYATITDLDSVKIDVNTLDGDIADINTLIFGSATGTTIQTSFANAVIAQLGNAQIKSAMIESISASKITSGDIVTNNVRVKSEDGSLLISDETMQISDGSRVRVQIGKDASNDYSINIWDQNGALMFSKGGITDSAIKDAIIRNDMVSDTANIAAHKLDIDSLFEEINGSTNTIKSTKVYLDDKKQTLDVAFKSISDTVTSQGSVISSQGTAISAIQGQISSKIWQQDINTASNAMNTKYTELKQTVDGVSSTVTKHTTELSNLEIGGRNLLSGYGTEEITLKDYQGIGGFTQFNILTIDSSRPEYIGKEFTVSLWAKSPNGPTALHLYNSNGDPRYFRFSTILDNTLDTEWKYYQYTFTNKDFGESHTGKYTRIEIYAPSQLGVIVKKIKVEMGNKATDWSPAPENADNKIADLTGRVTSTESSILQLSNKITSNVTETTNLGNRTSTLEQTASSLEARLKIAEGDIVDAAKTATNYLGLTTSGLVVGNMTSSTLGNNVLIDTDSVDIRNGSTTLASFGSDYLYLAKNSRNATINMCNGLATMYHASKYSYDSLFVIDTAVVEMIGASTPLCLTSTSSLENVSIQFANSSKVLGGIGIVGSWLRRYGSNMFDTYTILDSGNFHDVMDGGWVHCTYGDGFTRYSNSQANIQVRKIGKQVYLRGEAKPTTAVTPESETSTVLAVIPEGYRPSYRQNFVMQGSSAYRWLMSVYPGGNICISRYTNDTTMNKSISAGAWLCCYAQWTID